MSELDLARRMAGSTRPRPSPRQPTGSRSMALSRSRTLHWSDSTRASTFKIARLGGPRLLRPPDQGFVDRDHDLCPRWRPTRPRGRGQSRLLAGFADMIDAFRSASWRRPGSRLPPRPKDSWRQARIAAHRLYGRHRQPARGHAWEGFEFSDKDNRMKLDIAQPSPASRSGRPSTASGSFGQVASTISMRRRCAASSRRSAPSASPAISIDRNDRGRGQEVKVQPRSKDLELTADKP